MPIYEYQCTKCGHRFEVIQRFSNSPRKKCEKCGARAERLISSPAIQFKGSGWYVTDYARKGSSATDGKGAETAEKQAAEKESAEKKTDKKKPSAKSGEKAGTPSS